MTWTIILTTHTDEYDKKLGDVISQNNRPFNKKRNLSIHIENTLQLRSNLSP